MSYYEGKMSLCASNSCMQLYMLYKSVFLKLQKVVQNLDEWDS